MTPQLEAPLAGRLIDKKRTKTWRWPSAVRCVPRESLTEFAEIKKPEYGDLVLCQVTSVSAYNFIENIHGANMPIFEGTVLVGVFAPRYAPDEYEGMVPEELDENNEVAMLNRGGTVGHVTSKHAQFPDPTMLKVLGFLKDDQGRIANTRLFSPESENRPVETHNKKTKLTLVVGTSMNSGKSNAAKAVVYALTACGYEVTAGKATGQAARRDVLLMKSAGAVHIADFADFGYPSTSQLPEEEVLSVFWQLYNRLHDKVADGGHIVIEIADGILQRETAMILADPFVRDRVDNIVFAACDSLSAAAGVDLLRSRFQLETTAISGLAANSKLGLREVADALGEIPIFNAMTMNVPKIVGILA